MAERLDALKARAYRKADKESDPHVSDTGSAPTEATTLVNEGYAELWDLIVNAHERYFETSATFTIAAGASSVALTTINAAGVQKVLKVERKEGTRYGEALKVKAAAEHPYTHDISFDVLGSTLYLYPEETAPGDYRIWYVPPFTALVNASDTTDARIMPGWEEYIVLHAAIEMRDKEESETARLERRKADLAKRIVAGVKRRVTGMPRRIANLRTGVRFRYMSRSGYPVE